MSSSKDNKRIAIDVHHIGLSFGEHKVLDDVTFQINQGTLAALLGPNGSGKTTLMKVILGLQKPDTGLVQLFGSPLERHYGHLGYVSQHYRPDPSVPMTTREFLDLSRARFIKKARIDEVLRMVDLDPSIGSKQVSSLSGGQLQRVLIARALLPHPNMLFLDEPSTGIDIAGEKTLFDLLVRLKDEEQMTILMISHEVGLVSKYVDQVVCLNTCLVCSGPPQTALKDHTLEQLYGEHMTAHRDHHHSH